MITMTDKVENRFRVDVKKLKSKRDILTNVHYTKDGHIEMTNGFIAIRLKDVHDQEESLKHGKNTDEEYPNLDHIFSDDFQSTNSFITTLHTKQMEDFIETFKSNKPDKITVNFLKSNNSIILTMLKENHLQNEAQCTLHNQFENEKNTQIHFTYHYLLIVFKFIRMLGVEKVECYQKHENAPVNLVYKNLHVIIMPVRKN